MERETLILAAQSGDTAALERLLAVCETDARRHARRHCAASDIDDAVQESLLILARKVSALERAAAFTGWLFTIVRRECHRLARRMLGRSATLSAIAETELACRSDQELRVDLVAALESLPAHYREVILLRDFAELTIAEMAEKLGMQPPGVKSRLHRARELVREYLVGDSAG